MESSMPDMPVLEWLADEICRKKQPGRVLKVGIDGRCAAGKSMLADALAPLVRAHGFEVLRPSVDGFHHPRAYRYRQGEDSAVGYYEDAFDYRAIADVLLDPLSHTEFPVVCKHASHDVRTDVAIDALISVSDNTVLLFDGVFLFRPELNPYWDLRILVHVGAATSLSRAIERDTGSLGSADVVRHKYERRYEPAWRMYCDREGPDEKADTIIDNQDFRRPSVIKAPTR
jgi:uridine kinase